MVKMMVQKMAKLIVKMMVKNDGQLRKVFLTVNL